MSADLLRRAAIALRKHAHAATDGPWDSLDGGDRLISVSEDGLSYEYVVDEPMSNEANAEYIALMHPPVALALADWLGRTAGQIECWLVASDDVESSPVTDADIEDAYAPAIRVARAVLREPAEPGPTTKDGSE